MPVYGPQTAEQRAGIVSFSVTGDADALFRRLNSEGCSLAARDGRLRVAPHVYNTEAEVDEVIDRLRRYTSGE